MANTSLSSSPLGQLGNPEGGTVGNNRTLGLPGAGTLPGGLMGGGGSNGNVPYLQQNCLPHNCNATSTSNPSTPTSNNTSHSSNSTSNVEEAWKSQQRTNSTQVHIFLFQSLFNSDEFFISLSLSLLFYLVC